MHNTTVVSRRSTSFVCPDNILHSRRLDRCLTRCSAQKELTEVSRRGTMLSSGLLLFSTLLPDLSAAESFNFVIPPEKLSAGQEATLRDAVRSRAEKRLKKVLAADDAPFAMRLILNDAGTYDYTTKSGGFDGSIVLDDELDRSENATLKPLVAKLKEVKKEVDEENAANEQAPLSWADLLVLAARIAVSKEWIRERRKKTTTDEDAVFITNAFGASWPVKIGRVDSNSPGPTGKIPSADASVEDIKKFLLQLGAKPDGGFAYKPPFYERPGFVLYTSAQNDPSAAEEYLATDPDFAVWKKNYDTSRKTITRTNYEVDFITYFDRLTSLGAKFDKFAYLKPIVVKSKK